MTLNKDEAKHQNDQLYDDATQAEILDVLASDGDLWCCHIAPKIGKSVEETRWHLTELRSRGEVSYNWISGKYAL